MKVLIYKRTHTGDPDNSGCFGVYDCMGQVRSWTFGAVIGVGGVSRAPVRQGIARKVTWVGIGPTPTGVAGDGFPILAFQRFRLMETNGPWLKDLATELAQRMFAKAGPRFLKMEADDEIKAILKLARKAQSLSKADACRKSCSPGNYSPPPRTTS
jgi:hypothetical protein